MATRRKIRIEGQKVVALDETIDAATGEYELNESLIKETFVGVKHIMERASLTKFEPVIFIIKNIKIFNPAVLNDLIHLLKKYRNKYALNFCLILGVQNNNKEEIHLRINIQNCTKLVVKNFYFPSMK